ncbi:MAG TPA: Stk1 family PASTA domain-containing Ser/Thr kinase [Candidatus Onthousia excrementipullorum]|uniref:non-specific serine/threonine protein kinase n=1 Tax=Candidatus Onthousia excrementipullorum TaxID=2840884 RepID=A0A9D1J3T4_9FIRM|nr:Stk1 family PASTA domain-containing Ser/Thr kinase [Candidatus Onthousia excrementipullorum]
MVTKGQKINGRYEIIKSIGEGGMANVYLAYDTILDRNVAIKVLRGDLANDEKFVRRFQREALSASSLSHPNIVAMYDVGEDNGLYYIVMEYVEGKTLKQLLKKRGSLTLSEAIDIMLQLTDGMAHAHDSYIVHRDLKPQNIMIQDDGQIKITDFGIAMALNSTQLTQTNSVMGSVHYLPPEQAAGKGATIKSDIYSMGIIFYELLTGELPFKGDSAVEIALKQMKEPLPDVHKLNNDIPQSIENIILKATAKNPKNRYDDAKSMHNDLLTALNDDRINEPPYVYPYPENEVDETTKIMKPISDENEGIATPITDEKVKKSNKLIIALSIIAGVIVVALISVFFIIPALTAEKDVKVPDVSGMTVSKAEDTLEDAGLTVNSKIEEVSSEDVKKNRIIRTDPKSGSTVKEGTRVTLYKSTGVKTYELENYVNMDVNEVRKTLEDMGLEVKIQEIEPDSTTCSVIGQNLVISQSLDEGSEVKSGDDITLTVLKDITFPDWYLQTADAVTSWANNACVTVTTEYQDVTDKNMDGKIITQSRPNGSTVRNNDSVTITIGRLVESKDDDTTTTEQEGNNGNNNNNNNSNSSSNPSSQSND